LGVAILNNRFHSVACSGRKAETPVFPGVWKMLTRRNLLTVAMIAAGIMIVAGDATQAFAQGGGGRTRLIAQMSAGQTKGKAKYEQRGARRKFSYELQDGVPGTAISVRHAGNVVGNFTVDAFGRGKFELDTDLGEAVPVMATGQVIEAWNGGGFLMSGVLQPR
jgi:hypothetical protein